MLLRSTIVAMVAVLVYGAFTAFGPKPAHRKMQSQWQDNRFALERFYLEDSPAQMVIVGSSLAKRLPTFGDHSCIENLALSGDSALTGLSAVLAWDKRPSTLFVEINVPDRRANTSLVDAASGIGIRLVPMLRVENFPVNLLFSFLQRQDGSAGPASDPPAPASALEGQRAQYSVPIPSPALSADIEAFAQLITAAQAKGVHVSLFEMPVHPSLEQSAKAIQIRSAFRSRFPDLPFVTADELSRGVEVLTTDGVHLRQQEAAQVAKNVGVYAAGRCHAG